MGPPGDPVSKADLADRHPRPSRARPLRGHRSSRPVLQSRVPAHLLRRSRARFRDVMQQGTRDRADRHHAPARLGELHTGTWLKLELDSTVSMASTVPMVSHAPLVSLTSSITRAHGSPHRPGHNDDTRAVARRRRRRSTWSPVRQTARRPGGACRQSEASASLANRYCTHVIRPPSKTSHGFGATGRSRQRSRTRLPR